MKKIIILAIFIIVLMIIAGCKQAAQEPYSCEKDSDCFIKNVGNCCGYYPRCVNINYEPDLEAVKAQCSEKQMVGVCGYPDITGCKCINNRCESMQGNEIV